MVLVGLRDLGMTDGLLQITLVEGYLHCVGFLITCPKPTHTLFIYSSKSRSREDKIDFSRYLTQIQTRREERTVREYGVSQEVSLGLLEEGGL